MAGHGYSGFYVYGLNGLHNCTTFSFAVVGGKMAESGLQSSTQRVGYLKVSSAALQVTLPWLSVHQSILPPQNAVIPKAHLVRVNKWL